MRAHMGKHPARQSGAAQTGLTAENPLVRLPPRILILLLALLGFVFSLISCYRLTVSTGRVVGATIAFAALFTAVFSAKRRGLPLLILLLAASLFAWRNAETLLQGLLVLIDSALSPLNLQLPDYFNSMLLAHDAAETLALSTRALTLLLFPVSLLAASSIINRTSLPLLALATLPLLSPAPFFSLAPDIVPFFCLVAAFLMLFIGSTGKNLPLIPVRPEGPSGLFCPEQPSAAPSAGQRILPLAALPLIALTVLLASWILPEDGYARPKRIEAMQEEILSWDIGGSAFAGNDGLTHGNLRSLSDIHFTGDAVLKVRLSEERPLYLRDFAGVQYTEDGWKDGDESAYRRYADRFLATAPQNLHAAAFPQSAPYTLAVRNLAAADGSIWIPNGLVTRADELNGAGYVQDTALHAARAQDAAAYELTAVPCEATLYPFPLAGDNTLLSAYRFAAESAASQAGDAALTQTAASYIDYIFDVYTALPEQTLLAARQLCETYGLSLSAESGSVDPFAACHDLYILLSSRCTYAYSPPHIPEDVDFTTYFLTESRSGYCVHFATAATVLLRALGVPARYAEGYIVIRSDFSKEPDAEGYIDIEDTHAHAWVEVFDPVQLEWIPVEMTASASGGAPPAPVANSTAPEATATPTPTPIPTPVPTPEPTPEPTPDPAAEETPSPSPNPSEEPETTGDPDASGSALAYVTPTPAPNDGGDGPDADNADGSGGVPDDEETASAAPVAPFRMPLWLLCTLLLAILLPLAAYIIWAVRRARLRRQILQTNVNQGVLALCRHMLAMLTFAGAPPMTALQSPTEYAAGFSKQFSPILCERLKKLLLLAQRATFSNSACTKRERDESVSFVRALRRTLAPGFSRLRRLFFRWLYPKI